METLTNSNKRKILANSTIVDQYENNVTEFSKKQIEGVLIPSSVLELSEIVASANDNKKELFIISTGKNWGLGSKQPVANGSTVVHLKKLNQIIEVNESFRYAIIEPGVTQKQLSDHLLEHHSHLKFPVTGSAEETSIIGNMLERGVAAFGHRNQMIVAMEVLLSDGEILRTGFWHYLDKNNPLAFHYPFGHGPDLRGLFTQSNLGIVTKMVVRLQPRLEGFVLTLKFKESCLKEVTNLLRQQFEQKLLDDGIVITNQNDPRTTNNRDYQYSGNWIACASFSGPREILKSKRKLLRRQFGKFPVELFFIATAGNPFGFRKSSFFPFAMNIVQNNGFLKSKLNKVKLKTGATLGDLAKGFSTLKNFYHGIPSNYSIETMAMMNQTTLKNDDLDNSDILGISLVLPAVPFDGDAALEIGQMVNEISKKWDVQPFHNLASVGELSFEGFYRIYFDRKDPLAVKKAHSWSEEIHNVLRNRGYYPYRIDNKLMKNFVCESDVYWRTIKKIKDALDKNGILAKGKYGLI